MDKKVLKKRLFLAESEDFSLHVLDGLKKEYEVTIPLDSNWELKEILQEYDVFWFRLAYRIDAEVLEGDIKCKYLVSPVTGINHIDEKLCEDLGIHIVCLRGEREFLKEVRATAEMTIGLTLSVMRHIPAATEDVKKGNWRRDLFRGKELYKKTVGIVGIGRLGKIVAEYFIAMGMKVLAYDPFIQTTNRKITQLDSLVELLSLSDVVSLHINLTKETTNYFDEKVLNSMKKGSYLINTSRGELIDENALLQLLKVGHIAGAALDVLWDEHTINFDNPLIKYSQTNSNLIIVPHIGGNTYESFEKTETFIAHKLLELITSVDT